MSKRNGLAEWTENENLELLRGWTREGFTERDIAEKIGIDRKTLHNWKTTDLRIAAAMREGKEFIDFQVESALLMAALGAVVTETRIIGKMKGGEMTDVVKEKTIRELPPNVLACQTWLYNRQREKWKRNRDNEIEAADEQSINITIKRAGIEVTEPPAKASEKDE